MPLRKRRSRNLGDGWVGQRGSKLSYWGHSLYHTSSTVDDGVESVDRVGSVLNDTLGAIGFDERVRSADDISRAGLLLALVVTGQSILAISEGRVENVNGDSMMDRWCCWTCILTETA
uniref:Uncharacterized protein n=1 Tax=Anopheles melas TaxID=34690 RepID=A0A182UG20_9DIPT